MRRRRLSAGPEVRFVEDLPETSTGKIMRRELTKAPLAAV